MITREKPSAVILARRFVEAQFPRCKSALLVGSAVNGQLRAHSDLDVVILIGSEDTPYRESLSYKGRQYEVFLIRESDIPMMFNSAIQSGTGALLRMCAEGRLLRDNQSAAGAALKIAAQKAWRSGPPSWSFDEMNSARNDISDDLFDLIDAQSRSAMLFCAASLMLKIADFILRVNNQWSGVGKWQLRALKEYDADAAERLGKAADQLFLRKRKTPLIRFIKQTLTPYGGPLQEGHRLYVGEGK